MSWRPLRYATIEAQTLRLTLAFAAQPEIRSTDRGDVAVCTDACLVRWIDRDKLQFSSREMFVALRHHCRLCAFASDANCVQTLPVSDWRLLEGGRRPLAGFTAPIVPS